MTPRLFQAGSMRDALVVVREAFGDSAVIVDTKVGDDGVEVWAASDDPALVEPPAADVHTGAIAAAPDLDPHAPIPLRQARRRRLRHPVLEGHSTTFQRGRFAFVGPCGAGKTSLVAKLAANHVLRYGPEGVGVITLDQWRPGGVEELLRLTRLLKIPLSVCATGAELNRQLEEWSDCPCVLIDTPGVVLEPERLRERLLPLAAVDGLVARIVTLPLTLRAAAVRSLLAALGPETLEAAALTHGDDVDDVGEVLDELDAQLVPAYWLSTGPDIPDDVESADGDAMQRLLAADDGARMLGLAP